MSDVTFSALYLPLLLAALALILCIVSFICLRSYLKRRTSREWIIQEGILKEIRDEVNALLKTIDETTDRDITLLTERERSLRTMLAEVEKRFKVYVREMDKRPIADEAQASLFASETKAASPESGITSSNPKDTPPANDGMYLDLGKLRYRLKRQEAENTAPALDTGAVKPKTEPVPAAPPSVSEQVHSLLKEGLSAQEIAARLKLSIAEVEFKAALLERRNNQE